MDADSHPHLVEVAAALKEITARITSADALPQVVDDLIQTTATLLPTDIRCAVTLVRQGTPAFFSGAGLAEQVVDELRGTNEDGPCLEAIRTRTIVANHDLTVGDRWPQWSRVAVEHGVRAVLSYPFDVDAPMLGALGLYCGRPGAFDRHIPILAMLIADHAAMLLRIRLRQSTQDDLLAQVHNAPADGACLDRAIGIVMAQRGCPPEQALRHLHDAATHLGVGVAAVAERLVRTVADRGAATPVRAGG